MSSTDRIEKSIEIKAPISRVWQALTDYKAFGTWFRVALESPFVPGETVKGYVTYPGYEHLRFSVVVVRMDTERVFSFNWHPYAIEPERDYSDEEPTLVEFTLAAAPSGTLVRVVESGFDKLPPERRSEAFRMNENGWAIQVENIRAFVEAP